MHAELDLKEFFHRKSISTVCRRRKNLKEILAPSSYRKSVNSQVNFITPCNFCDTCKHYLVAERKFTSKVIDKTYYIKGDLSCNSKYVIYVITCDKCKDEYVGSALDFNPCFRAHKSDMKTKKERCGTSRHFSEKCLCSTSPFGYVKFKPLNRFTRKTHQILKKCFGIEKDTGKFNFSQLPMG